MKFHVGCGFEFQGNKHTDEFGAKGCSEDCGMKVVREREEKEEEKGEGKAPEGDDDSDEDVVENSVEQTELDISV